MVGAPSACHWGIAPPGRSSLLLPPCRLRRPACASPLPARAFPPPSCCTPPPCPRRLPAYSKLHSILTAVSEELPDAPLYFNLHDMCKTLRSAAPKADVFKSALVNAGYR